MELDDAATIDVEIGGQMVTLTAEQIQALKEEQERAAEERMARLANLAATLSDKRKEAISGRASSGVEEEWREAEDAYDSIDSVTRQNDDWRTKPPGQRLPEGDMPRSTVLPNITRPYVDTAAAKIGDMLLPSDDRAFAITPTPVPELIESKDDETEVDLPTGTKTTVGQAVQDVLALAKRSADAAQDQVDDWLTECQFHGELREVINDCARLGSGVIKGPIPEKKAYTRWSKGPDGIFRVERAEKIKPVSRRISCWNIFPDPACGESIHNGGYIWERDEITGKQLVKLKGLEGYLDDAIDAVLAEGPKSAIHEGEPPSKDSIGSTNGRDSLYQIWYFHGMLEAEDLEACGCEIDDDAPQIAGGIAAKVTMVNDRVIRAVLNPLDTGAFPYDIIPYQKVRGRPWGKGLANHISVPQRILTAALRALMDNAGRSAGPQAVVNSGLIQPQNGRWDITPWKVWTPVPNSQIEDIQRQAFAFINVTSAQGDLMAIIQFALRMAEEITGMPLMLQGQMGKAPDTLGGMQLLQNNASSTLRRLARLFDDYITEPHIGRYYDWLMQYGENEEAKGEYVIDARGSSALVERALQNERIMQMAPLVLNPAFGIDPMRWFAEMSKSQHLDPKAFQYSEDERKQLEEQRSQQPPDPRIATAQMRLDDSREKRQFDAEQRQLDRQHEARLTLFEQLISQQEMAGERAISIDKIKAMLAQTAIDSQTKKELFSAERALKLSTGQGI